MIKYRATLQFLVMKLENMIFFSKTDPASRAPPFPSGVVSLFLLLARSLSPFFSRRVNKHFLDLGTLEKLTIILYICTKRLSFGIRDLSPSRLASFGLPGANACLVRDRWTTTTTESDHPQRPSRFRSILPHRHTLVRIFFQQIFRRHTEDSFLFSFRFFLM